MKTGSKLLAIARSSDEAFGIVALLNGMEKWKWELENADNISNMTKEEIEKSKPKSKYSIGLKGEAKKYEGWNAEGTDKFNELKEAIDEDRKQDQECKFDEFFSEKAYLYSKGKYGKGSRMHQAKKKGEATTCVVEALMDIEIEEV